MFKNIPFLITFLAFSCMAQAQLQWGWARSFGAAGDDYVKKIATDSRNGIYAFGNFKSTGFMLGSNSITNAGGSDLLLVKYDSSGNVQWARSFGSAGDDSAYSITTDRSSNVLIAGSFKNSISFGSVTLTSAGGSDIFLVKLNPNGTVIWAKQNTAGSAEDKAEIVKADRYNNIYLAGRYKSNDFTVGGQLFPATGLINEFYCKLDSNGNFIWKKINSSNADYQLYDIEFLNSNHTTLILAHP
jgi:hypothetical protein